MIYARPPERMLPRVGRWAGLALLVLASAPAQSEMLFSEALQRAVDNDPAYAGAFAQRRVDQEIGEQERAGLRPTVSVSGGAQMVASDSEFAFGAERDQYPTWSARLEARQPIFRMDWGARRSRADANDELADAQFRQRQVEFIARVAERYLAALQAQDQRLLTQAEVDAVERSLDDVRKRYAVELVAGVDLKEAQARFDLARAELIRAEGLLEQHLDALAELTGPFQAPLPRLRAEWMPQPLTRSSSAEWLSLLEGNSAVLRTAELRIAVAEADRKSRRADTRPQADLVLSAGRTDASQSDLGSREDVARLGVEVTVPIYAGGLNSSRVRESEARIDALKRDRDRLVREAEREVRAQFRNYEVSRISVEALAIGLESARAAASAVMAGYDAGTRTISDVLDARRQIAQAERDLNGARYDLLTYLLLLQAATGTLEIDDVLALDPLLDPVSS